MGEKQTYIHDTPDKEKFFPFDKSTQEPKLSEDEYDVQKIRTAASLKGSIKRWLPKMYLLDKVQKEKHRMRGKLKEAGIPESEILALSPEVMRDCRELLKELNIPTSLTKDIPVRLVSGEVAHSMFDSTVYGITYSGEPTVYLNADRLLYTIALENIPNLAAESMIKQRAIQSLKSTIAHEYFHQLGYKYLPNTSVRNMI